jgi:peptidyl-prolyl cis-trans isomerase SurA
MKTFSRTVIAALAASLWVMPYGFVAAQSLAETPSINSGNDLSEVLVRGKVDPKLRKAAAIVNGAVVTDLDVEQRLALVVFASGGQISPEERQRLRAQILRNLIDEQLQVQEAKEQEVTIESDQVEEAFQRVASNFRQSPGAFDAFLERAGTSSATLKEQIRAELAWSRVLRRKVEPFINVGDDEVQQVIDRLQAAKGQDEFRVAEIFLTATPATEQVVLERANAILEQLRKGASFVVYARQFSEASTAAVGGDMGWMRVEQLPEATRAVVESMSPGQVSNPVRTPSGYVILALAEKRKVLAADPAESVLTMKQIAIALDQQPTDASVREKVARLNAAAGTINGCGSVEKVAEQIAGEASDLAQLRLGDFPDGLQPQLAQLQIGQATRAFATPRDVRVLVMCGRDDPPQQAPDFDQVYAQLNEQRISIASRRYMRDLRRDAIIDYR